jgi:hypothetical protein
MRRGLKREGRGFDMNANNVVWTHQRIEWDQGFTRNGRRISDATALRMAKDPGPEYKGTRFLNCRFAESAMTRLREISPPPDPHWLEDLYAHEEEVHAELYGDE